MNHDYRPLPEFLTIKINKDLEDLTGQRELGLYALDHIDPGTNLGISHIENTTLNFDSSLIRTPLGGFINHSLNPNVEMIRNEDHYIFKTIGIILKDEELTVDYNNCPCGFKKEK